MPEKHGSLSINSENIFPVIKKWLYSDHDIFYRELVSNGCDAITKLKKLDAIGEYSIPEDLAFSIQIYVDSEEKTIRFVDNGIGMSESEVEEYINQIAFSGAQKFMETYKDKTGDDQIIGHFGLGFYSAFMVADRVTINTKSYRENEPAVFWESEGGTEFAISDGDRTEPGTEITLYLNEDSYEFCNEYRAREVLNKYCSFMPVEIYLTDVGPTADKRRADDKKREEENNRKR
ncbi:MAG: ATP-binding protein, partial [Lachnospiraceae bacterium]|nr:ATP-binding protein [Lachnospiraceae bacterium]